MGAHRGLRPVGRVVRTPFALLLSVVLATLTVACRRAETPEAQIRRALDEAAAGLEARDVARATAILDEAYADTAKRTKQTFKQIAFVALRRGPLLVALEEVSPRVTGDTATVQVRALAVQGNETLKSVRDILPSHARLFDVTLTMRRDGDAWRVTAIEGDGLGGFTFD